MIFFLLASRVFIYSMRYTMPKGDNPKSQKNLQPNQALDKPGDGRSVGVWFRNDQLDELDKLEGGRALHVRKAVDLYLSQL
jgi:hypothetical protein